MFDFDIVAIIGLMFTTKEVVAEKLERKAPLNTRFDWDAYWLDVKKGVTTEQQIKKRQNGSYITTLSVPDNKKKDFNYAKYRHDKDLYGEAVAEMWKKNGLYNI